MAGLVLTPSSGLQSDSHLPSFRACHRTEMRAVTWRGLRLTVREGCTTTLAQELRILSHLAHPQLLLRMGHTEDLRILFEPVMAGSLFLCLHHHKVREGNLKLDQVKDLITWKLVRKLFFKSSLDTVITFKSSF